MYSCLKMRDLKFKLKVCILSSSFLLLLMILPITMFGQIKSGVQLNLSGGGSFPTGSFNNKEVLAGKGFHLTGGLDYYFFKVLGIGIEGGYFENDSKGLFKDFIFQNYLFNYESSDRQSWQTKYIFAGPTIKTSFGRFEIDFTAKWGVYQTFEPKLLYIRTNYGEPYDLFRSKRNDLNWDFGWNTGIRTIYKLNKWFGLQAKAEYWTTKGFNKLDYNYTFRKVTDFDRNGHFDDIEFSQASLSTKQNTFDLNVFNIDFGLVMQFGHITGINRNPAKLEDLDRILNEVDQEEAVFAEKVIDSVEVNNVAVVNVSDNQNDTEIMQIQTLNAPDIVSEKSELVDNVDIQEDSILNKEMLRKIFVDSLNDAGELHFSVQMYREAATDFSQILDEPSYPRVKYMYALSLSLSGQCDEAKKEFKEFKKSYTGDDIRSLEVIFVSQFENCAGKAKEIAAKLQQNSMSSALENNQVKDTLNQAFQVQFIAIKKADVQFLSISKMGDIRTEYTGNKKLYRYLLTGYQNIEDAKEDLKLVRSKGFHDAFIVRYEHGKRVETMCHEGKLLD